MNEDGTIADPPNADEVAGAQAPATEVTTEPDPALADPVVVPSEEIDWSKRVEEWGGEQSIADAISIAQALQDEDGVKALVQEGLKHLGYDPNTVFNAPAGTGPEAEPEDPDRLMTAAEVEARIQSIRDEQTQAEAAANDSRAQQAVYSTIEGLELADDDERRAVLSFAQKYASPEERNPEVLVAAIAAGHADYVKTLEAAATRYVTKRQEANAEVPTPLNSGGSPGGEEAPQPKNMDDARAAARRYLKAAGELDDA